MNALRAYDINIAGLENKRYEYDFTSDDTFFAALEQDLIGKGNVQTHLTLDKSETMIRLDFHITGTVEQVCDRSLDEYDEVVDTRQMMLLKFGDHNEELSDEIELIERNTATINVARYIFEFISLSLPMKRLHPRFRDEDDADDETNGKLIYRSDPETEDSTEDQPAIDPRWAALRKLSDN
ncbi:DUF177 domain-containing protein [Spirosoma taeanense]|uniref:DUF177 domain-containing protein n=1 Tax=Spirosoma taeanense TaxID=2735870 RepID=A0A6M5YEM7_9BACT|nr:DUF177 domain-containing protein [Spirosoma taeanense]QJW92449.1 DUF177 domain-containing protein [Spirosoma taeanense]